MNPIPNQASFNLQSLKLKGDYEDTLKTFATPKFGKVVVIEDGNLKKVNFPTALKINILNVIGKIAYGMLKATFLRDDEDLSFQTRSTTSNEAIEYAMIKFLETGLETKAFKNNEDKENAKLLIKRFEDPKNSDKHQELKSILEEINTGIKIDTDSVKTGKKPSSKYLEAHEQGLKALGFLFEKGPGEVIDRQPPPPTTGLGSNTAEQVEDAKRPDGHPNIQSTKGNPFGGNGPGPG